MTSVASIKVGLDYHDSQVQVCVLDDEGRIVRNRDVANDWQSVREAVPADGRPVHAAIEACCGAADLADELAERAGWSVSLAHPGYVARLKQSPDKSDYADARLLADLLRVGYLPKVWLAPQEVRELRRVVRFRQQLVRERRNVKLSIRALLRDARLRPPAGVNPWTRRWLAWLKGVEMPTQARWVVERQLVRLVWLVGEIRTVERHLAGLVSDDALVQRLRREPGIGLVTAATLRAEIGRFDRFRSGKQLSRFCGLTPRNASSGQKQADAGLIKAGNPQLRSVLIEVAQQLLWRDPRWMAFGVRLKRRGKPHNLVVAAVANRWLRRIYHQLQPERLAA
jgi:transposase